MSIRQLLCTFALAVAGAAVQAQDASVAVKDYDVYVDLPTAFAFIKLPSGWKFIGKLDAEQMRHLPAGTLTALLKPEADDAMAMPTRMAAAEPMTAGPAPAVVK